MESELNNKPELQAIENIRIKSAGKHSLTNHTVTINFHPDRFASNGLPILKSMAKDGLIKSQFETGTSNGGLTAYIGGDRWLWERNVFDGAYDNAPNDIRPKYGAINFKNLETGASSRFGSAYFCLKLHVFNRTTFCYPDSFFEPKNFASFEFLESLIELANNDTQDLLDSYIEAQIHGVISLKQDVECLVLDPAYKSSFIEEQANELNIPIRWHSGYELSIDEMELYPNYRGEKFINIAREISVKNTINPKLLGIAVTQQGYDEQDIKKVWHYLARFGYK